ncbi:hypothetical protein [Halobacillus salinus]|uniref:hypothetical protein n=1 Tax=Halobacillus salinus TaxID=192814 RepID=UPI0009A6DBC8|nr:hypothetical protein [Halobacillus salinus]
MWGDSGVDEVGVVGIPISMRLTGTTEGRIVEVIDENKLRNVFCDVTGNGEEYVKNEMCHAIRLHIVLMKRVMNM